MGSSFPIGQGGPGLTMSLIPLFQEVFYVLISWTRKPMKFEAVGVAHISIERKFFQEKATRMRQAVDSPSYIISRALLLVFHCYDPGAVTCPQVDSIDHSIRKA